MKILLTLITLIFISCKSHQTHYVSYKSLIKKDEIHYLNNKPFTGFSINRTDVRTSISEYQNGVKHGIQKSWDKNGKLVTLLRHNGVGKKLDESSIILFCKDEQITMWIEVKGEFEYTYIWNEDGSFKIREIHDLDLNFISEDQVEPTKETIEKLKKKYMN